MGAILIFVVARLSAISAERLVILLILTPTAGFISYLVTEGPLVISTISASTPKFSRVSISISAFSSSSYLDSEFLDFFVALSKEVEGKI